MTCPWKEVRMWEAVGATGKESLVGKNFFRRGIIQELRQKYVKSRSHLTQPFQGNVGALVFLSRSPLHDLDIWAIYKLLAIGGRLLLDRWPVPQNRDALDSIRRRLTQALSVSRQVIPGQCPAQKKSPTPLIAICRCERMGQISENEFRIRAQTPGIVP